VSRRDEDRLADILESIDRIRDYRDRGADAAVFDAILYRLLVLGEAAGSLSDETIATAPEIEWRAIVALRTRFTMSAVPPGCAGRRDAASSVAPVPTGTRAPCVLASHHPSHPSDEVSL